MDVNLIYWVQYSFRFVQAPFDMCINILVGLQTYWEQIKAITYVEYRHPDNHNTNIWLYTVQPAYVSIPTETEKLNTYELGGEWGIWLGQLQFFRCSLEGIAHISSVRGETQLWKNAKGGGDDYLE